MHTFKTNRVPARRPFSDAANLPQTVYTVVYQRTKYQASVGLQVCQKCEGIK